MTLRALVLALVLSACVAIEPDEYTCLLVRSCGEHGWAGPLQVPGNETDVGAFVHDWVAGCQALTASDVCGSRCHFVLCLAVCEVCDEEETLVCRTEHT